MDMDVSLVGTTGRIVSPGAEIPYSGMDSTFPAKLVVWILLIPTRARLNY